MVAVADLDAVAGARRTPTSSSCPGALEALLARRRGAHPEAGALAPTPDRPRRLDPALGALVPVAAAGRSRSTRAAALSSPGSATGSASRAAGIRRRDRVIDWAHGAFLLVRRDGVRRGRRLRHRANGCTPRTSTSAGVWRAAGLDHALRARGAGAPRGRARRPSRRSPTTSAPRRHMAAAQDWMARRRGRARRPGVRARSTRSARRCGSRGARLAPLGAAVLSRGRFCAHAPGARAPRYLRLHGAGARRVSAQRR